MGLKARMIVSMLEKHSKTLEAALNQKLGTAFTYSFDLACIPENVDGWNWNDDELKTCFYNSYFRIIEDNFQRLFAENAVYREAITAQVKTIKVAPGRSTACDFDLQGDALIIQNTLGANQLNGPSTYFSIAQSGLQKVIDSKLS